MKKIAVINPGSTSTKIAYYNDDRCVFAENIQHPTEETEQFTSLMDQLEYRRNAVCASLERNGALLGQLDAIVVRGGLLRPLDGGVYLVDDAMCDDLYHCRFGAHASNLGAVMALPLGRALSIPVYTVDPVTVDEFDELARFSGLKGMERLSMSHALNMKAVARKTAEKSGKKYEELNLVVAHLGSGISVSAHLHGRMVDVNNANNEGPFSLERCGTLPALALTDLCFSGRYTARAVKELVTAKGGIYSYLGTKNFKEVADRIAEGDGEARLVTEAMAYQVAKEIGAMAAVLSGRVEKIVLTGGMAHSTFLTGLISERVAFIAPVELMPGEEEMEALAAGALRVLRGTETAKVYGKGNDTVREGKA